MLPMSTCLLLQHGPCMQEDIEPTSFLACDLVDAMRITPAVSTLSPPPRRTTSGYSILALARWWCMAQRVCNSRRARGDATAASLAHHTDADVAELYTCERLLLRERHGIQRGSSRRPGSPRWRPGCGPGSWATDPGDRATLPVPAPRGLSPALRGAGRSWMCSRYAPTSHQRRGGTSVLPSHGTSLGQRLVVERLHEGATHVLRGFRGSAFAQRERPPEPLTVHGQGAIG